MNGIAPAVPNTIGQYAGQGLFGAGMQMTHAQVLGMFSGVNGRANGFLHGHPLASEGVKATQNGVVGKAATSPLQDAVHDPKGSFPQNENSPASPSQNAGGSPPRGKIANPKHPDLVLQL
jgi:bromodomain-containing protein 7/9